MLLEVRIRLAVRVHRERLLENLLVLLLFDPQKKILVLFLIRAFITAAARRRPLGLNVP